MRSSGQDISLLPHETSINALWIRPPANSTSISRTVRHWWTTPHRSWVAVRVPRMSFRKPGCDSTDVRTRLFRSTIRGYLYRIVRNLSLDLTRSMATEKRQPDSDALLAELPAVTASPEQEVVGQDELQQVADALARLPERTRMAFEMHRLGGYTLQQVASALGISVGLTHHLVHEALSHCAAWLDRGND